MIDEPTGWPQQSQPETQPEAKPETRTQAQPQPQPQRRTGPDPDPEGLSRFVERFASELVEAGVPRMPARVFAALMASEKGQLTAAELGEQLQVSPAAISGAIRYLTQVGLISREREPGSRRERYRLHDDQWYLSFSRRNEVLLRWESTLRTGVEAVGTESAAGRRLEETLDFFAFLRREMTSMLDRWIEHRDQRRREGGAG
ncbi:GbsR/MarR family transcriptional regulator [Streptomyces xinghaiensis]|uniref:GbsR/MarR family transcriptional regulator n=1 Tax=Streptomyces xinghaiensis TaxID=1038928 RepID=UPI0003107B33